jgi:uncharacterized protein YdeI (BOF family)
MNLTLNTSTAAGTQASAQTRATQGGPNETFATQATLDDATATKVSKPAELLAALTQLQQQDPARFKDTLGALATDVRDQAKGATGRAQQQLSGFAAALDTAARTGDLAALKPPPEAEQGRGLKAYPPAPPPPPQPKEAENDGDRDDAQRAAKARSTTEAKAADPRAQVEAAFKQVLDEVNKAITASASQQQAQQVEQAKAAPPPATTAP